MTIMKRFLAVLAIGYISSFTTVKAEGIHNVAFFCSEKEMVVLPVGPEIKKETFELLKAAEIAKPYKKYLNKERGVFVNGKFIKTEKYTAKCELKTGELGELTVDYTKPTFKESSNYVYSLFIAQFEIFRNQQKILHAQEIGGSVLALIKNDNQSVKQCYLYDNKNLKTEDCKSTKFSEEKNLPIYSGSESHTVYGRENK